MKELNYEELMSIDGGFLNPGLLPLIVVVPIYHPIGAAAYVIP